MNEKKNIESILEGCLRQDRKAQYSLYQEFAPKMLSVCRRYCNSQEEAEDIMMEGFMKVFQKLNLYQKRNDCSLFSWIKSIMVNQSIDYLRAHRRQYEAEMFVDLGTMEDVAGDIVTNLDADHILKMMDGMPEKQRVVFNLREVEGYEFEEIATIIQEPINTVRVHLFRARQWLQKHIKEEEIRQG
ncbi:MAG: RNA polymerase sigma factor [Bacteroidales bacterium]|nr:RNA polymerase sigma factor [Bacteroidales bacterium]